MQSHFIMLRVLIFEFSIDCDSNMFGQDCREKCGECVNKEHCHHINGTCLNGCNQGYRGLECKQGNRFSSLANHDMGNLSF